MMRHRLLRMMGHGCITTFLLMVMVGCGTTEVTEVEAPTSVPTPTLDAYGGPSPELSPAEVVKIQVEALQENDAEDNGIARTFLFASPENKSATGPLPRFILLLNNPLYKGMLNHAEAIYGTMEVQGDVAKQPVTIIDAEGNEATYMFTLSKQVHPAYKDSWMTDSVLIISPPKPRDSQAI